MTRTRSQMAAAATTEPKKDAPAASSIRIQKSKTKLVVAPEPQTQKKTLVVKQGKKSKVKEAPKEITYKEDMVNLNQFIKKFDMEAVLDQTGNSIGDSHLPRATLNEIIKKALPADVRAQKETMDLICFISNAFVDLLSDTANNVCYSQNKKNIIQEHALRALQQIHLDEYLPFLISDNQNQSLQDIMKSEKKVSNGLNSYFYFDCKVIKEESRDSLVTQMLKRLIPTTHSLCTVCNKKKKKCKCRKANDEQGQSTQELIDRQNALWEQSFDDDSDDAYRQQNPDGEQSLNESPSMINGQSSNIQQTSTVQPEGEDVFKENWIAFNMGTLQNEYQNWVNSYVQYNIEQAKVQPEQKWITDQETFMTTYPAGNFYNSQYQEYIQSYYAQQPPQPTDSNVTQDQQISSADQQIVSQNQQSEAQQIITQNDDKIDNQIVSTGQQQMQGQQESPNTKDSEKVNTDKNKKGDKIESKPVVEDVEIDFDEME